MQGRPDEDAMESPVRRPDYSRLKMRPLLLTAFYSRKVLEAAEQPVAGHSTPV